MRARFESSRRSFHALRLLWEGLMPGKAYPEARTSDVVEKGPGSRPRRNPRTGDSPLLPTFSLPPAGGERDLRDDPDSMSLNATGRSS